MAKIQTINKILTIIWNNPGITRLDLVNKLGLSFPTISKIVNDLEQENLLEFYDGPNSSLGRKPQALRLNVSKNLVIGVNISGSIIQCCLSDLSGEFIYELEIGVDEKRDFDYIVEVVTKMIKKALNKGKKTGLPIFGVGVAVCGITNSKTNIIDNSPVFGWENVDLKSRLDQIVSLPVFLGNVSHLIALSEQLFGQGNTYQNFACVNLSYGIGSGIILNNQLFLGSHGFTGEIGHIIVQASGSRKGKNLLSGTLESVSSEYAILESYLEKAAQNPAYSLLRNHAEAEINPSLIFQAANEGEKLAMETIHTAANYLGIGIDVIIKLFDVRAVFISGKLVTRSKLFMAQLQESIQKNRIPGLPSYVEILPSSIKENPELMGAIALVVQQILSPSTINRQSSTEIELLH